MKKQHHLANVIVVVVLVVAFAGLYLLYRGTGRAVEPVQFDALGNCCCKDAGSPFIVSSGKLASEVAEQDCLAVCQERSTVSRPVWSLGSC
ncbi:hypothetical protein HY489_01220 [Candidatus Woesearchaeota archaeon]|nr:hypothetical protein [Candidatus Woesearchaeota archaeon]